MIRLIACPGSITYGSDGEVQLIGISCRRLYTHIGSHPSQNQMVDSSLSQCILQRRAKKARISCLIDDIVVELRRRREFV